MGLDMYLRATKSLNQSDDFETVEKIKDLTGSSLIPRRIVFDVMYWRKANAIHKWFVDNVQFGEDDCVEYDVSIDDLKSLYDLLKKMLAMPKDEAVKLLPTTSGFFFGSTDYDDYYWSDITDTVILLKKLFDYPDVNNYWFTYQSSW